MKNKLQPIRTSFSRNFQCKKAPCSLSKFFHFGTENGEGQLKKSPCNIHDKEDDENQSINQKPMCFENLENDHNMRDQSGSYDNYQGDNYEHHQGVNNDKLVKN